MNSSFFLFLSFSIPGNFVGNLVLHAWSFPKPGQPRRMYVRVAICLPQTHTRTQLQLTMPALIVYQYWQLAIAIHSLPRAAKIESIFFIQWSLLSCLPFNWTPACFGFLYPVYFIARAHSHLTNCMVYVHAHAKECSNTHTL